jgi:hypothetical protein
MDEMDGMIFWGFFLSIAFPPLFFVMVAVLVIGVPLFFIGCIIDKATNAISRWLRNRCRVYGARIGAWALGHLTPTHWDSGSKWGRRGR